MTNADEDAPHLGVIDFRGRSADCSGLHYDRIAVGPGNTMLMVSLAAETQKIKAARAILCKSASRNSGSASASGGKIPAHPNKPEASYLTQPGNMSLADDGYLCFTHKLEFGMAQAIFIAKVDGFMPVRSRESLWSELMGTRYTTPILPEWMDYLEQELSREGLLINAACYNCSCAILAATDADLDRIVSEGLRKGSVSIPQKSSNLDQTGGGSKTDDAEPARSKDISVYLDRYGQYLGKKAIASMQPLHVPGVDRLPDYSWAMRPPLPGQAHVIAALAKMFRHQGSGFLCGECGVGKSIIAMMAVHVHAGGRPYRAMILCPDHLIAVWKEELELTMPDCDVITFDDWKGVLQFLGQAQTVVKDGRTTRRWHKPERPTWVILGRNQAKFNPDWIGVGELHRGFDGQIAAGRCVVRKIVGHQTTTDEDGQVVTDDSTGEPLKSPVIDSFVRCPKCGAIQYNNNGSAMSSQAVAKNQTRCMGHWLQEVGTEDRKEDGLDRIYDTDTKSTVETRKLKGSKQFSTVACEEPLWNWTRRPAKYPPAKIVHKKLKKFFDYLIIDECFPAGTMIATQNGATAIQDIRPGDTIKSVHDGKIVQRKVVRLIVKSIPWVPLIKIRHENGDVWSTPNHKFYTDRGLVPALELRPDDQLTFLGDFGDGHETQARDDGRQAMPPLRDTIRIGTDQAADILLQDMLDVLPMGRPGDRHQVQGEGGGKVGQATEGRQREDEGQEQGPGVPGEGGCREARQGIPRDSGRERHGDPGTTGHGQGYRIRHGVSDRDGQPTMEVRPGGPGGPEPQDRRGGGRALAPDQGPEEPGPDQGEDADRARVDHDPGDEQGSQHGPDGGGGEDPVRRAIEINLTLTGERIVYDIEVEDTHCYFADGVLVSNCHEAKSDDSAQSMAAGRLMASVKHVLAMTGTIIGGYASHLMPLLMRISPETLRNHGFAWGEPMKWSSAYGRVDKITTTTQEGAGGTTYSKKNKTMRKAKTGKSAVRYAERPGIMPGVYGDHMLGNTVFLSLDELEEDLPDFFEYVGGSMGRKPEDPFEADRWDRMARGHHEVACEMTAIQRAAYEMVEEKLAAANLEFLKRGSLKLAGTTLATLMGYPDRPFGWYPEHPGTESVGCYDLPRDKTAANWIGVVTPPDLDANETFPKEQALIDICVRQKADMRQSWVYCQMTGKRDVQSRLKRKLEDVGLSVCILRAKEVEPRDRKRWIDREGPKYDVIISHPKIVSTGLTLFAKDQGHNFSTLIFYETGYMTFDMIQASRRSWRIGQPLDCRVYYLYYKDTAQERAVLFMGKKIEATNNMGGTFSSEGIAAMSGDDNAQMQLAKALKEKIDPNDIQRSWTKGQSGASKRRKSIPPPPRPPDDDGTTDLQSSTIEFDRLEVGPQILVETTLRAESRKARRERTASEANEGNVQAVIPMMSRETLARMYLSMIEAGLTLDDL